MSSINRPFGLSAQINIGGKYKGQTNPYPIVDTTTPIGIQDALRPALVGGNYGLGRAVAAGTQTTAAYQITGVAQGFEYIDTYGNVVYAKYIPANVPLYAGSFVYATVADDPYGVYEIQCNAAIANGAFIIGRNYDLVIANANAQSGFSTMALNLSTVTANAYTNLKVIGLGTSTIPPLSNSWNDNYPVVNVIINNHAYKAPTTGL